MKTKAKTGSKTMPSLYNEEVSGLRSDESDDFVKSVPTFYSVQSSLYRSRAKTLPLLPHTRADIQLPQEYTETSTGKNFLLHQFDNIIIFATIENLRHLSEANTFFGDGTFNICPDLFYQLYTIHAFVNNKMVSLVFGLLPDKKQITYTRFFEINKRKAAENNIELTTRFVFTDFEVAAQNAASEAFHCDLKACLFHYRQAVWRNAQKCGLQGLFKTDDRVNLLVRRASALPLVRLCDIDDVWLNAMDDANMADPNILKFCDYVTEQWVESEGREVWNHFDTEGCRTTNHLEGWHGKLKKYGPSHPNMYKFVDILKREQDSSEIILLQIQAGGRLPPKRRKYRNLDADIRAAKEELLSGMKNAIEYADTVS